MKRHTTLETERLVMRESVPGDAEAVFRYQSDPDVMRHTGEPPWPTLEETQQRLASYPDYEAYGYGRWQVLEKHLGAKAQPIGFAGLKYLAGEGPGGCDEVDLGFRFLPDRWGRGYATECGRALTKFGFEELRLTQIVAYVLPENDASRHVLHKLGFVDDGIFVCPHDGSKAMRFLLTSWLV